MTHSSTEFKEERMDGTSWPDAIIASSAIISGASLVGVLVWQISRIIQTGMTLGDRRNSGNDAARSNVD
jgi:hypothetical protein